MSGPVHARRWRVPAAALAVVLLLGLGAGVLEWRGVPDGTSELALVIEDPDAPDRIFVHWLVVGISAEVTTAARHRHRSSCGKNGRYSRLLAA